MADEGTAGDSGSDTGSVDAEASGMLADAVNDDGGSHEDNDSEQFDADKAKERITKAQNEAKNLRKRLKELEPLAQEAQQLRDSQKSELEKLTEKLQAAEATSATSTTDLLRLETALDLAPDDMSKATIRKLAGRLKGSTREELEEDAKELFAEFASTNKDEGDKRDDTRRPTERLGSVRLPNSESIRLDDETDPRKLAANIRRL